MRNFIENWNIFRINTNMNNCTNAELLTKFPPILRKHIVELWRDGKVGLCAGNIEVTSIYSSKCLEYENEDFANCFTLRIPYAGQYLVWDVIFSNDDLTLAPDFYFDDEAFLSDPEVDTLVKNVPSLVNWKHDNAKGLLNVIKELLKLYKMYQIKKLEEADDYTRIYFEYCSLNCETGVSIEDVEVLVQPSEIVHFLILIPVDYSRIPPYIQPYDASVYAKKNSKPFQIQNPGEDTSMLLVTFHRLDGSRTQPQLLLSPAVQQILSGYGNHTLPPCPPEGCLMDYIPEVRKILSDKIEYICTNYRMKNEYISQLLANHGNSVVEYDILRFSKISFLFETKNFHWLLVINIGNRFPEEKPKWTLRSVYYIVSEPFTQCLEDYPYSPRWSCEEMVQRAHNYALEHIDDFRRSQLKLPV